MNTNILIVTTASEIGQGSNEYQSAYQLAKTNDPVLPILSEETATIHVFYDAITKDFCATCSAFGGLVSWGFSPDEAQRKLQEDLQRYCRQATEEAQCATAFWI